MQNPVLYPNAGPTSLFYVSKNKQPNKTSLTQNTLPKKRHKFSPLEPEGWIAPPQGKLHPLNIRSNLQERVTRLRSRPTEPPPPIPSDNQPTTNTLKNTNAESQFVLDEFNKFLHLIQTVEEDEDYEKNNLQSYKIIKNLLSSKYSKYLIQEQKSYLLGQEGIMLLNGVGISQNIELGLACVEEALKYSKNIEFNEYLNVYYNYYKHNKTIFPIEYSGQSNTFGGYRKRLTKNNKLKNNKIKSKIDKSKLTKRKSKTHKRKH